MHREQWTNLSCVGLTIKKRSVSCPAGVQNVASRVAAIVVISHFLGVVGKYCPFLEKKDFFVAKMGGKKSPVPPFLFTRLLHRKHNYFHGQPCHIDW